MEVKMEINSKVRKLLEKYAHDIQPVVIVGGNGISDALKQKVCAELEAHELIKVKFNDFKDEKRILSEQLAQDCSALLVRVIGNIAILYKQNEDPAKRSFKI